MISFSLFRGKPPLLSALCAFDTRAYDLRKLWFFGLMKSLIALVFASFLGALLSCAEVDPQPSRTVQGPPDLPLPESPREVERGEESPAVPSASGLLFTSVDVDFRSSTLSYYDFASGQIKEIFSGGSGDPVVMRADSATFVLAQRAGFSRNLRTITLSRESDGSLSFSLSSERALPDGFRPGDPHALSVLPSGLLLLAGYVSSQVFSFNNESGVVQANALGEVSDLDTGSSRFRPEALGGALFEGRQIAWVLHQGLSPRNGGLILDERQSLFVSEDGSFVDADSETQKIQGVPLGAAVPNAAFAHSSSPELLWVEQSCSRLVGTVSGNPCDNQIALVDLRLQQVVDRWQTNEPQTYMNGPVLKAASDSIFYRLVDWEDPAGRHLGLRRYTFAEKTIETVYEFEPDSGGYYALAENPGTGTVFIGERRRQSLGGWVLLRSDGSVEKSPDLPLIPYNAVLVEEP